MFVSKLVKDRFEKQVIMMEQNGLDRWTYWLVTYIFDYLLYICVIVIVTVTSLAFNMRLFTQVRSGEELVWSGEEVVWSGEEVTCCHSDCDCHLPGLQHEASHR